jgi:hypothetical protein
MTFENSLLAHEKWVEGAACHAEFIATRQLKVILLIFPRRRASVLSERA